MPFNLFGPPDKNDIRVGYISTDRGFVDSVSICDANEYAKKNPGTTFIFRTRDIIRYLNINGINSLTDKDLVTAVDSCTGIELESDCGPPRVLFYGGGGVGVQGNPVIGEDGAVLAVDLVYGGYGYQYPPIVEIRDRCGIGVGAVTRAILGEVVETFEVYDQEGDFEDYELCLPEDVGYGRRYDPDGKDIGSWDPTIYANLKKDPIRIEIQRYQDVLQKLTKPWWTTRKYAPLRVTSGAKVTRTKFDVTDKTYRETRISREGSLDNAISRGEIWNEFMNTHAISPVPPSNVVGSDFATTLFTFEWEENFPFNGEYTFRGCADGAIKDLYIDNIKIGSLNSFNENAAVFKKNFNSGVHRIRLDLKNGGLYKDVFTPSSAPPPSTSSATTRQIQKEVYRQVDDVFVPPEGRGSVGKNASFHRYNEGTWYKGKRIRNGGDWNNTNPNNNYIQWDGETRLTLGKYHPGKGQRFGIAVWKKKTITETVTTQQTAPAPPPPQTSSASQTTRSIFNTVDYISKADRRLWRARPVGAGSKDFDFATSYGVLPFNPDSDRAQRESFAGTHVIRWQTVDFPVDGNYVIETWVDDNLTLYIGNRSGGGKAAIGNGLTDVNEGGDEVIIKKRGFTPNAVSTGKSIDTRFFKAGKYRIRAELNQSDVGPLGSPKNPMTLAINITLIGTVQKVLSPQSWNLNPMGVALTIDAPVPSLKIPQEPIPEQEGRCPNNPIWSTRFPTAQQRWWPVQYSEVLRANGITPWSDFLNRYAVSPIPPLSLPGTDGGGVIYTNSWQVDIPYDGFYQFAVQRDETARIYLDGNLAFDIKTAGDMIWKDFRNKPKFQKVFISKGRHTISVELENRKTEILTDIDRKVFSTKDWLTPPSPTKREEEQPPGGIIIKKGGNFYLLAGGNDLVEISFKFEWDDNINIAGIAASKVIINTETGPKVVLNRPKNSSKGSVSGKGTFKTNKEYLITIEGINSAGKKPEIVDTGPKPDQKQQRINLFDAHGGDVNAKLTSINAKQLSGARVIKPAQTQAPTTKNGVTYSGPPLANYLFDFLSPQFSDPFTPPAEEIQGKTWVMTWSNVDFFEDGQYTITAKVDDVLVLKIDGAVINTVKIGPYQTFYVNTTKGKKTVQVELSNLRFPETSFKQNPTYFFLEITKRVRIGTGVSKSWVENPVAISAILIPPPCPKRIRGKGVVTDVIVDDPGNGYVVPQAGTYPTSLRIKNIIVENPGINYGPNDTIQITPNNGAILEPVIDNFGRVTSVNVLNPGLGFTRYPDIRMVSPEGPEGPTGVNAIFRPQFEVVRDPIVVDPDKLIQVTDLVGLKQTGYVDGRAYYGAVFYKEGVRYAGFYETPGDLVQVYDTLQESIDAQVTTPPSAIQRQGTDVSSNDPRLNLPNTPENLI